MRKTTLVRITDVSFHNGTKKREVLDMVLTIEELEELRKELKEETQADDVFFVISNEI